MATRGERALRYEEARAQFSEGVQKFLGDEGIDLAKVQANKRGVVAELEFNAGSESFVPKDLNKLVRTVFGRPLSVRAIRVALVYMAANELGGVEGYGTQIFVDVNFPKHPSAMELNTGMIADQKNDRFIDRELHISPNLEPPSYSVKRTLVSVVMGSKRVSQESPTQQGTVNPQLLESIGALFRDYPRPTKSDSDQSLLSLPSSEQSKRAARALMGRFFPSFASPTKPPSTRVEIYN